jgi:hypothetical protein
VQGTPGGGQIVVASWENAMPILAPT